MQVDSTMLSRLRTELRLHQCVADADGISILSAFPTVAAYQGYLVRLYGFQSPLESALAVAPGIDELIDLPGRCKTQLILDDLRTLGMAPESLLDIPHCAIAPFRDLAEALGWIYVSERNATMHNMIVRGLLRRAPELRDAMHYFECYDALATERWSELGDALDMLAGCGRSQQILEAVIAAFDHQHRWLRPGMPCATAIESLTRRSESFP